MGMVFLTGFMGTGKSSVGHELAEALGGTCVDLDGAIVSAAGMSVNEIFASYGEPHFRDLETETLRRVAATAPAVLATGGGVVLRPENRRLMREAGVIVNLTATVEEICRRLASENERPLLRDDKSPERLAALLAERESCYADADVRIATAGRTVPEIVREILGWLQTRRLSERRDGES